MTEKDVQDEQDAAVGQYMRLKQNLETARERIQKIAQQMHDVAKTISSKTAGELATFDFHSFVWLNPEAVKNLAEDQVRAEEEAMNAREKAMRLGAALSGIY